MHDDARDLDAVRLERVQGRHAEMTGADKGNPHGLPSVVFSNCASITCRGRLSPRSGQWGGAYQQGTIACPRPVWEAGRAAATNPSTSDVSVMSPNARQRSVRAKQTTGRCRTPTSANGPNAGRREQSRLA